MSRDNERWIADLKSGQESALADLRIELLRNLRKSLSNRNTADDSFLEDAVQDSMIRIIERIDQFEGRSRFLTWATSIAIHVAMGDLRRSRWKDVSLDELVSKGSLVSSHASDGDAAPDAQLERLSLLAVLERAIREDLTERQRTALLAELRGMPQQEIARHLGSNRNAIYKLTHDARKRLRAVIEAAGYTATDVSAIS